jgi:hypothetical protein
MYTPNIVGPLSLGSEAALVGALVQALVRVEHEQSQRPAVIESGNA